MTGVVGARHFGGGAAKLVSEALLGLCVLVAASRAEDVVPSSRVETRVRVRGAPTTASVVVGALLPGERARLLGSVPSWYRVELVGGQTGFVSKAWTELLLEAEAEVTGAPEFTLDAVDVGTGLAIVVRGVDFTLVYDGGSNDDEARRLDNRLMAFLRHEAAGLATIDHVILSHPHKDHVELLPDVFGEFSVRYVWDSGAVNQICGYRAFLEAVVVEQDVEYHDALHSSGDFDVPLEAKRCYGTDLPERHLTVTSAGPITEAPIILGTSAVMTFLHADGGHHSSFNENSLVVRLDLGDVRVLLMGDAEAGGRKLPSSEPSPTSVEGILLACCAGALAADVLVVGHHGSKTSSRRAFLDAVGADTFIVSAGPKKYGSVVLPDAEVITELTARGTVLRTDRDDAGCGDAVAKIGPDADGRPGGCDNIRLTVMGSTFVADYHTAYD